MARGALKPQELCYLLHLCKGSNSSRGAETSLLARLQEVLWEKGGGGKEGGRGGGLEGADLSSRGPEQQLERRRHKEAGGEGGRVAPSTTSTRTKDDDVIIFLQISDIHLDRQFSEVAPPPMTRLVGVLHCTHTHCVHYWRVVALSLSSFQGSPSMCNLYLCCRAWYNGTVRPPLDQCMAHSLLPPSLFHPAGACWSLWRLSL